MKIAYLVYPGLGKTTLAKANDKFEDIETKLFKDLSLKQFIGTKKYPNYRGQKVINFNPEYPNNLIEYTKKLIENDKILLLVYKQDSIDLLNSLNIDYDIILPSKERLNLLKKDYIKRKDSKAYIENNLNNRYVDSVKSAKQLGKNVFFLKEDEYLGDFFRFENDLIKIP